MVFIIYRCQTCGRPLTQARIETTPAAKEAADRIRAEPPQLALYQCRRCGRLILTAETS